MKEACAINKSLSSLGDVFMAIGQGAKHIPYRNSKLTHLLAPCLGGDGKTLMLVNVAPEPESAEESMHSLKFAASVNAVELGGGKTAPSVTSPPCRRRARRRGGGERRGQRGEEPKVQRHAAPARRSRQARVHGVRTGRQETAADGTPAGPRSTLGRR